MRAFAFLSAFSLVLSVPAMAQSDDSDARRIFERYLAMPFPDAQDTARQARIAVLAELKGMPQEAVSAAERVLFEQANPRQRHEIVSALGDYIHTEECAKLLYRVLQDAREPKDKGSADYEVLVRSSAVHGLRMMSRRTNRSGGKRIPQGPDFEPKVKGLIPYLISAANDKAERVRVFALYGLADSRDPIAAVELKKHLDDTSWEVRFYAACFLTEYQDAAGLPEMRAALTRFMKGKSGKMDLVDFKYYGYAEMLLASFERITGKSFGEIPLNPDLSSVIDVKTGAPAGATRYMELLRNWDDWWYSQPPPEPEKTT